MQIFTFLQLWIPGFCTAFAMVSVHFCVHIGSLVQESSAFQGKGIAVVQLVQTLIFLPA